MSILTKGRFAVRAASDGRDLQAALALRSLCFRGSVDCDDRDQFDDRCTHLLLEDTASGTLVSCFRLLMLDGASLESSYCAQTYDLTPLSTFCGPMLELGRFCIHPAWSDPDILRLAWGALTAYVDRSGVGMLFGCSSFVGIDPTPYRDAFAVLRARHMAPEALAPREKASEVVPLAAGPAPDVTRAMKTLPPLLRTYLVMGGWVSDHAVVDRDMNTLHEFTGLEIAKVPEGRARLLRAVAG